MLFNRRLLNILNLRDSLMLIVGNILGIGIFTTTGYIAQYLSSPGLMLLLWIIGGLLSFCGGVTYAELSSRFPKAGGDYNYLYSAFHPLMGFLFGWSALLVTYTGSIAVIAVGFANYFLNFFPKNLQEWSFILPVFGLKLEFIKLISIFITFLFTYINVRGLRTGSTGQNILTICAIIVLFIFIIFALFSKEGNWQNLTPLFRNKLNFPVIADMGVALIGIYFTYSGWTVLAYMAGEIKTPDKTIPLATILGISLVTVLYFLINVVYLYAFPLNRMINLIDIGFQTVLVLLGKALSFFFLLMISIAVLSTLNSTIMSGARVYYAMSREGQLFSGLSKVHPKYKSPANALWLQLFWSILLILSGSFNQLLTYTVFVMVCFSFLSGISLILLRKRSEDKNACYQAWGYPVTTFIFIGVVAWIMINTLLKHPFESLLGLILVLCGIPFYFYFRKRYVRNIL